MRVDLILFSSFFIGFYLKIGGIFIENKKDNCTENQNCFSQKIGDVTYNVTLHFSKTSKETIDDKIKRLVKNDIEKLSDF